jgi:hypothetical protein
MGLPLSIVEQGRQFGQQHTLPGGTALCTAAAEAYHQQYQCIAAVSQDGSGLMLTLTPPPPCVGCVRVLVRVHVCHFILTVSHGS